MRACLGGKTDTAGGVSQDGAPDVESSPEVVKDRPMTGMQAARRVRARVSLHGTLWLTVPPTEPDSRLGRRRVNKK